MAANFHALHLEHILELRGVIHVDLQEEDWYIRQDVVVLALLSFLQVVLALVARLAPIGDDVDLAFVSYFVDKPLSRFVYLYPLRTQLGRAPHPRDKRGYDDRDDEERGDYDAVGPLYHVGHQSVDEHEGDRPECERPSLRSPAPSSQGHRDGRRGHHGQDAGGVGSGLGVHIGLEDDRDRHSNGGVDQPQRSYCPPPLRHHAVARQVARHYVQKTCHRRRPREPQDRDRAQVVDRAESIAQVLVRHVRERAPVGFPAGLELLSGDEYGCNEGSREQVEAHDQGGCCQQLTCIADTACRVLRIVALVATHERHQAHPSLET